MAKNLKIAGRLESIAVEGVVTGADQVYDDAKRKLQSQINDTVDSELAAKAYTDDVNRELATKADTEAVESALRQKADATATREELDFILQVKANKDTVTHELGFKANTVDVNDLLAEKVSTEAMQDALALKANISDVDSQFDDVAASIGATNTNVATNAQDIDNLEQLYQNLTQSGVTPMTAADWATLSADPTQLDEQVIYRVAGTTDYTDYMYNGTSIVTMATYNNVIDSVADSASTNLISSAGAWAAASIAARGYYIDYNHLVNWVDYSQLDFRYDQNSGWDSFWIPLKHNSGTVLNLGNNTTRWRNFFSSYTLNSDTFIERNKTGVIPEGALVCVISLLRSDFPSGYSDFSFQYVVDSEPTEESPNLVTSGGVVSYSLKLKRDEGNGFIYYPGYMLNTSQSDQYSTFQKREGWSALVIPVTSDTIELRCSKKLYSIRNISDPEPAISSTHQFTEFPVIEKNYYGDSAYITRVSYGSEEVAPNGWFIRGGTQYCIINLYDEFNPDLDLAEVEFTLIEIPQGYKTSLTNLYGKTVSILGASVDTYKPYSYGYDTSDPPQKIVSDRYPRGSTSNDTGNDVINLHQTWWQQVLDRCGATLGRNNSIGGTGISRRSGQGYSVPKPCFLDRYDDLFVYNESTGEHDIAPDYIFIHGLSNESNTTYNFDPTIVDSSQCDEYDLAQAYQSLTIKIHDLYPTSKVVHHCGTSIAKKRELAKNIVEWGNNLFGDNSQILCDWYPIRELKELMADGVHPTARGMMAISDYVVRFFEADYNNAVTPEEFNNTVDELEDKISFTEEESSYHDPDILKYIVDENYVVIGYIYKNGSIEFVGDDVWKYKVDTIINSISSDSIYDDDNVLKYIVDDNNLCIGIVYKDGAVRFLEDEGWRSNVNELLDKSDEIENMSSPSPYDDPNIIKYITDTDNVCIGYIKKDGTVFMYKAEIESSEDSKASADVQALTNTLGVLSSTLNNIELSKNQRLWNSIFNISTPRAVKINNDNQNSVNLKPCISIIDDDTVDNQIPDSKGASEPTDNTGGYFSVLLPLTLSLAAKHHRKVPVGLACEGHRVGFTTYRQPNDDYSVLNTNGNAIKWLHNNMGWNVFNHSMTAQLPQYSYYVDGITSELANTILAESVYSNRLSFWNTCVLDRLTGKWYEPNSTRTEWVERVPTKKYAQIFYQDYNTHLWYFNRNFDFDYSWGEWVKRADELGFPNEKLIVHNGGTTTVYTISASRKYALASIRTTGTYNNPPLAAAINRVDGDPSNYGDQGYNTWNDRWVAAMESILQKDIDDKSWVILMTHTNDQEYFRNYYLNGRDYPSAEAGQPELRGKDTSYSSEWIIPLKNEEILDIIGENTHDYINHPPSRLGISSWDEWHPAPGTHLAALYYILDEALDLGIDIIAPYEGYKIYGNLINIGVDKQSQSYSYATAEETTPYTDEEKSYLTVGADMTVRYFNSKTN